MASPNKVYEKIVDMRGNLLTVNAKGVRLGELAQIRQANGGVSFAQVISFDGEKAILQSLIQTRGIATNDRVNFLGKEMVATFGPALLGRCFSGSGVPIDGKPAPEGEAVPIATPAFNPVVRIVPREQVYTNIPMIDVFNCLVKSQKIPIFSVSGEPYNALLMRIANQTSADIVIIVGMGLRHDDYQEFIDNTARSGREKDTIMFIHKATDPAVECLLAPDMALAVAENFAVQGKNVLVLLTDMTAFADSIKEIMITMDQIPSNRGYPGTLYSDLAARYEKAVDIDGSGSITIIGVTTMPGNDVTHPVPDNTGYITEGQFYLIDGVIAPFGSLSRLKQHVIGVKGTPEKPASREDHGPLANAMIRLYAEGKKARERQSMGFKLSKWDEKLLQFSLLFESEMMDLSQNLTLIQALDKGWEIMGACFEPHETGIKQEIVETYFPANREALT